MEIVLVFQELIVWRHVNVCKHCIETVIVAVGYDLLVYFSSSCHQCTHLRLRWVHGYMDDFIFRDVN